MRFFNWVIRLFDRLRGIKTFDLRGWKPPESSGVAAANAVRAERGLPPIGGAIHASPDPAAAAVSYDYVMRLAVLRRTDPDLFEAVGNGTYALAEAEQMAKRRAVMFPEEAHAEPPTVPPPVPPAPEPDPVKEDCKASGEGCGKAGCKRRKELEPAPNPAPFSNSFTFSFDPFKNPGEGA